MATQTRGYAQSLALVNLGWIKNPTKSHERDGTPFKKPGPGGVRSSFFCG